MNASEVRFCPRCGSPITQAFRFGKTRPSCPECGWVFFADPKVAVAVLVQNAGMILLVRRANDPQRGKWTLPGGFMDAGEDPRQAAERECLEETGLQVRVNRLLEVVSHPADSPGAHLVLYYQAEYLSGELQPGDDAEQAAYYPLDRMPALAFEAPDTLQHYLSQGK